MAGTAPGEGRRGRVPAAAVAGCLTVLALAWLPVAAMAEGLSSPGCLDGGEPGQVVGIGPDLDLMLADGRDLQLPGIDPPRPADDRDAQAARVALSDWLTGHAIAVRALAGQPDRWGRTLALAFAEGADRGGAGRVSVAEALLDAGLARARPDPHLGTCWRSFLDHEAHARAAGLGLWTQSRYAVMAADDRARLLAGTGAMAIVAGRIARIGEGRARIYLSFGESRSDFAITVERRVAARLKAAGLDPVTWKGRQVRVRGFLDDRFGLQIDLVSADQIEFTDR